MSTATRRRWPSPPTAALGLALVAFAAVYLYLLRDVGLANDEWTFMLYRASGLQAIVAPYNNGPVVGEILLYRLWANTVGVGHHWVLSLVYLMLQCAIAVLVFDLARRRVGPWPALAAAVLVLVVGRAWETILFPATLTFVAPALAGCAAWAALDRPPRWPRQLLVGVLLGLASVTGGLGPALMVGLLAEICLRRAWRWLWMLAVGVVPLIAWYVGEAGNTGTRLGANLPHVPWWTIRHLTAAAGAVVGLPAAGGIAVIILAAGLIWIWRVRSGGRAGSLWSPRAVDLGVTLVAAAVSIGVARAADTPAATSRYLYFPAVLMVLLACEWVRDLPAPRARAWAAVAAGAVVVVVAAGLGLQQLRHGKTFYETSSDGTSARMGAMRLAEGPPLVVEPSRLAYTPAVLALFVRRFGAAPIDDETRLGSALPQSRSAADQVLASADVRRPGAAGPCLRLPVGSALPQRGLVVVINRGSATAAQLIRFAPPGEGAGFALAGRRTVFGLARDRVSRPWRITVNGTAQLELCAHAHLVFTP